MLPQIADTFTSVSFLCRAMAKTSQGEFSYHTQPGYRRTSPVRAFRENGYGLYHMIGNVWERTADWWSARHTADAPRPAAFPQTREAGPTRQAYDRQLPEIRVPRKVIKGGSHLCAPNYCRRDRSA